MINLLPFVAGPVTSYILEGLKSLGYLSSHRAKVIAAVLLSVPLALLAMFTQDQLTSSSFTVENIPATFGVVWTTAVTYYHLIIKRT